mgnify:CR=1 FL=1
MIENKKSENGITLIVLIITIIILLILAGITILQLNKSDLFGQTKKAKEQYSYSSAKERMQMMLMEYKAEDIYDEPSLEKFRNFLVEKNLKGSVYDIGEIIDEKLYVYDKEYKCNVVVDKDLNIIEYTNQTYSTYGSYEILTTESSKMNIRICLENLDGIDKIECPNGDMIDGENNKQIKFEYEVDNNLVYQFKIISSKNNEEVLTLDLNKDNRIEILETTQKAYSIITEKGIIGTNKNISINYKNSENNYYSIDNGNTWEKYTDEISVTKETLIMAKSIEENKITEISKKTINLQLASDTLDNRVCDNDSKTYGGSSGTNYIQVDKKVWGEKIIIDSTYWAGSDPSTYYQFLNDNKENIGNSINSGRNKEVTIPEGARYIKFVNCCVFEIKMIMIEISYSPNYPELTIDGVKERNSIVTINYYKFAKQKLYSLDNKNWNSYTEPVSVESGKTVYAKILDDDNNLIGVIENVKVVDSTEKLNSKAFDNNSTTYGGSSGTHYIQIDSQMWGRKIIIDSTYWTGWDSSTYYQFLNDNKEKIGNNINSGRNKEVTIPEGAKYIKFVNCCVFEIYIK